MGKLFLLAGLIAIADPILLFVIWGHAGFLTMLAVIFIPPIIGGRVIAAAWRRLHQKEVASPEDAAARLGDRLLFGVASFLFCYPGPITTLLGLPLLVPGIRRWLQQLAVRRLQQAAATGSVAVFSSQGGVVMNTPDDVPGSVPGAIAGGPLKQAEGRVIEGDTELPAPGGEQKQ
jgi:UPF0716 family protein affecting phage T7 exclusion